MTATASSIAADVTVVGAGAAGLYTALCAARTGARVALVSATPLAATASYWAQGGLAAALAEDDSPEQHLRDTEVAGRGAVRPSAARVLVDEAPDKVRDLLELGVRFDVDADGGLSLGLEGGHTRRRVAHAGGSATGRRIVRDLSALAARHPGIVVLERARAAALHAPDDRCLGVVLEDGRAVLSRGTVLATGGAAALWSRTTNPPGSLGIGLGLAHAAGADLADLEFLQFHPTAVIGVPHREGFLVTEAIRGEGATLHGPDGERFVDPARFPNVVEALRENGLDPTEELIPVSPAAHYMMGGIVTDLDARSTVPGLLAVGETACTGLHGANRLASNSLSECFVFGARAAAAALDEPPVSDDAPPPAVAEPLVTPGAETREALWRDAGLVRDAEGLRRLLDDPNPLARLIATCALQREESRGAHVRSDFPALDPALDGRHAVVGADDRPVLATWG
jgi:L-aspartate oxidase